MRVLYFLFLVCLSTSLHAQLPGRIQGRVSGQNGSTADWSGITMSLLRATDSSTVKFTVSDKQGNFEFKELQTGAYLVSASAVGHVKGYSERILIDSIRPHVIVPAITLVPVSGSMTAVTVTARRPLIEHRIDRTIVNVEASITNVGTNALEVLEKSPGISVDKDGNISLKGKEGVLVMIDGRPTQLSGPDLVNMLQSMNSNQLDQIEIMTNPPARYDAAGNAGIINIKTKKNRAMGYNGSVNLGYTQGRYPKTNEAVNFNYREGKINLFTNLSHNYRDAFNVLTIQRNLRHATTKEIENYFDQLSDKRTTGQSFNAKLGADYFMNKRTSFGIVLSGFINRNEVDNLNQTNIFTSVKTLESITDATVLNTSRWESFSTNLNFRTLLDTSGKELTADFDYIGYGSSNDQRMINSYLNGSGNYFQKPDTLIGSLPQEFMIYSGRIDYLHPLKNGARFEAGLKSSIVSTDNNAIYDSIEYGSVRRDYGRSNHFLYNENINAAYANLSLRLTKKFNGQLGLRYEHTTARGEQLTTGEVFERNYGQLFPTAYLQFKADMKNNFGLNYGRRIRRPNYESLNPFIRFMDRYTYTQGNPDLKPQFSQQVELSHTFNNMLTTTLNYTSTTDIIQSVIEQKGQEAYATQANIASMKQYGVEVSLNNSPVKWWRNSLYLNVYHNQFEGVVNEAPVSLAITQFSFNGSQQFKVSETVAVEFNGFYRSGGIQGVMVTSPIGMVAAGVSKEILTKKGNIRMSVRDIFFTQRNKATVNYGNVDANFQQYGDSRTVSLSFSYRFSKGKMTAQRKRPTGGAGDEQSRIGGD